MFPAFLATTIAVVIPRSHLPKQSIRITSSYALDHCGAHWIMTAQQAGVCVGDRLEVAGDVYRVERIEYYLDPDDMFIAKLAR